MNADVGRIQVVIVLDPYIRVTLLELVHLSPPVVNSGMTRRVDMQALLSIVILLYTTQITAVY